MRRIVTVTANAAIDWTCFVARLRTGERQSMRAGDRQAGGKGVNVARVLAALGAAPRAVVVVGGATGAEIVRDLEHAGLDPIAIDAPGESRTCLEIVDEETGAATQLHGRGVDADGATAGALVDAVGRAIEGAAWLALCGSLSPGLPADLLATLVGVARRNGVKVALDSSGVALVEGARARPDLLRINHAEAEVLPGGVEGAMRAAPRGVVSDGAREIAAWDGARSWRIAPPRVAVRNPIGCGDAMLAGLLARIEDDAFEDALRFAIGLAAADAESPVAGRPDVSRANVHAARVELRA